MRSLSREARHERRAQVIRLREAKHTYDEIAALTGVVSHFDLHFTARFFPQCAPGQRVTAVRQ